MTEKNIISTPSSELTICFPIDMFYHMLAEDGERGLGAYLRQLSNLIDNFIKINKYIKISPVRLNLDKQIFEVEVRKNTKTE